MVEPVRKGVILYSRDGREFHCTGPRSGCGRKVAGRWDGRGRTTWVDISRMLAEKPANT